MKQLFVLLSCLLMAISLYAQESAQQPDAHWLALSERLSPFDATHKVLCSNPAFAPLRYSTSLTSICATVSTHSSTIAPLLHQGTGGSFCTLGVNAFAEHGLFTRLWGGASYSNGLQRDVRFCETADADLLMPYVMSDTVGGSLSREDYCFSGGVGHEVNSFILGLEGSYRASLSYRAVDPRPRNVVGDLQLRAGVSWLLDVFRVGASVGMSKYKQTNEVKFFNQTSNAMVYHLLGLGQDYFRFRGGHSEVYYNGIGWNVSADVATSPVSKYLSKDSGLRLSVRYSSMSVERIISSLNDLPLSLLDNRQLDIHCGSSFSMPSGRARLAWQMHHWAHTRVGIENVFGTPVSNYYPLEMSLEQYRLRHVGRSGQILHAILIENFMLESLCGFGMSRQRETYNYPWRVMKLKDWTADVGFAGRNYIGKWILRVAASMHHRGVRSSTLSFSGDTLPEFWDVVLWQYATQSTSSNDFKLSSKLLTRVSASRSVSLDVSWVRGTFRGGHEDTDSFMFSCGFLF